MAEIMKRPGLLLLAIPVALSGALSVALSVACSGSHADKRQTVVRQDELTLVGPGHFVLDTPARNDDGSVNVVVEIPAGTTAKWEVDKGSGALTWELENGVPRVVQYLGYPGNYGMVPRTLLDENDGGDGDPLDVLVLGPALERGAQTAVQVVAVLVLTDDGEQDDKLIAVREGTAFADVRDLDELQTRFPGVTTIVETWFANYKGPGRIHVVAWGDAARAHEIVARAARAFESAAGR